MSRGSTPVPTKADQCFANGKNFYFSTRGQARPPKKAYCVG